MNRTKPLKTIILIVISVFIISSAAFAFWFIDKKNNGIITDANLPTATSKTAKEDEKSDWNLYVNKNWQFRIKYPENYEIFEYQKPGLQIPIRNGTKYLANEFTVLSITKEQGMGVDEFYIKIYDCKDSQAVNSLISDILERESEGLEIQNCSINNLPCRKIIREGIWGSWNTKQRDVSYHIIRDTLVYNILFSANFSDTTTAYETIANSFQFVE